MLPDRSPRSESRQGQGRPPAATGAESPASTAQAGGHARTLADTRGHPRDGGRGADGQHAQFDWAASAARLHLGMRAMAEERNQARAQAARCREALERIADADSATPSSLLIRMAREALRDD